MNFVKTYCIVSLGLTLSLSVFSNENYHQQKDSLVQVIPTLKSEEKLAAYEKLLNIFDNLEVTDNSVKEYLQFANAAIKEAQKQGNLSESGRFMINSVVFLSANKRWKELDELKSSFLDFTFNNHLWTYYYGIQASYIEEYYLKTGQAEKAINDATLLYEKAKALDHPNGEMIAQLSIARALKSQRRFSEAENYFENGLNAYSDEKIIPPYISGWWAYCGLLIDMKQWDKAISKITQFDTIVDRYMHQINRPYPYIQAVVLRLYAHAYSGTGAYAKAEAYLNQADSMSGDLIGLTNSLSIKAEIANKKGEYEKALSYVAQSRKLRESKNDYLDVMLLQFEASVWAGIENAPNTLLFSERAFQLADSLSFKDFNLQLDELRTQFEVDKIIAEKVKTRNYLYLSIAICFLLLIALTIWSYFNRKITSKNKTLAKQIKELQIQYEKIETEILNKQNFQLEAANDLHPEKRKDQLCIAIRDVLLKEKDYRNPNLTRDNLIERLGTNKELFVDAFQYCFGMSFPEYINVLRLKDAITLLEKSDLTIEEISDKVGYGTIRTFQRQFQNKYNMSPKDYRKISVN